MIVNVYTFCYNEMNILPFVVDYLDTYADHVYVYDNGSTDGSIEFLQKFDWITVRNFKTEGKNNTIMRDIKNECWKESRGVADLVVVCDLDEVLCAKNIRRSLQDIIEGGYTIAAPKWYTFVSETMPVYEKGKLLHENYPLAWFGEGKVLIFDPNKIKDINFTVGSHGCNPTGEVKYYSKGETGDIYCLHICNNLGVEYKIKKYAMANKRRSRHDVQAKHGIHYTQTPEQIRKDYNNMLKTAINFSDLLNKE